MQVAGLTAGTLKGTRTAIKRTVVIGVLEARPVDAVANVPVHDDGQHEVSGYPVESQLTWRVDVTPRFRFERKGYAVFGEFLTAQVQYACCSPSAVRVLRCVRAGRCRSRHG